MRYTLLLKTAAGVVLYAYHARRLNPAGAAAPAAAFERFAREAAPGVHAVWMDDAGVVRAEPRGGSRLRDGMPVRVRPSPLGPTGGPVPKQASPSPYDAVRADGVATLLASADGAELWEACVAAVVGWDGERIVCVPEDRPRVWSTAEAAVREHLPVRVAAIAAGGSDPILLVNAVKRTCVVAAPGRRPFPDPAREAIERLFAALTGLPA